MWGTPVSFRSWVDEAAAYARGVADNQSTFGYRRVPGGGWSWSDANEPDLLPGTDFSNSRIKEIYYEGWQNDRKHNNS